MCNTIRWHITTPRELEAIVVALGGKTVRDTGYEKIIPDSCLCGVDIGKTLETVPVYKKYYDTGDWWVEINPHAIQDNLDKVQQDFLRKSTEILKQRITRKYRGLVRVQS